jgi:hypothetical protein
VIETQPIGFDRSSDQYASIADELIELVVGEPDGILVLLAGGG